jgi:hypothetical protein
MQHDLKKWADQRCNDFPKVGIAFQRHTVGRSGTGGGGEPATSGRSGADDADLIASSARLAAYEQVQPAIRAAKNCTAWPRFSILKPGDRVCLEGDNQKQADALAAISTG